MAPPQIIFDFSSYCSKQIAMWQYLKTRVSLAQFTNFVHSHYSRGTARRPYLLL